MFCIYPDKQSFFKWFLILGMVTAFCHQLGWKNMEMLISQFQDRLHFGIHSELIELMKLSTLNGARARTLFDAGFETIACVASSEAGSIENALLKAVPFQSEKVQEGDDSEDIRKRKKIKNIWITGNCGMTAREAAENLIIEARKYLELEIGVTEINWSKPSVCIESVSDAHEVITKENAINIKIKNELSNVSSTQHITTSSSLQIKDEPFTRDTLVSNCIKVSENKETEDIYKSPCLCREDVQDKLDSEVKKDTFGNVNKEVSLVVSSPILSGANKESSRALQAFKDITNIGSNPSILKDEIIWDSMNFTEVANENVTKVRPSEKIFSPNISFGGEFYEKTVISENLTKKIVSCKSTSVKDVSLFSSEGDNSSLFEESLPLDLIPSKLLSDKCTQSIQTSTISKQETASDFVSINSNSIINAFKTTIIDVDTDEDIKLVYEDDNKMSEKELETAFNLSDDAEVIETQNINETKVKNSYISPYKRCMEKNCDDNTPPLAKKVKIGNKSTMKRTCLLGNIKKSENPDLSCQESKIFTLEISKNKTKCYILKRNDILNIFYMVKNVDEAAIHLDIITATTANREVIGSNIVKQSRPNQNELTSTTLIKGITIYSGQNTCFYMDLASLEASLSEGKSKLIKWLQRKSTKLRLLCLKSDYVNLKKCFGIDLLTDCLDVSLTEWLINSEENVPGLTFLVSAFYNFNFIFPLPHCFQE